jgi:hypothetical protein
MQEKAPKEGERALEDVEGRKKEMFETCLTGGTFHHVAVPELNDLSPLPWEQFLIPMIPLLSNNEDYLLPSRVS